jgi:cellulose synthase/poly-beta-1,6-N-acetylglucosamine synthase-like glycosyltransferase
VFDAEDHVHPELLERVDACFERTGATVVQGGVQLVNIQSNWFSARNALEYWFWYRSRLHFHADHEYIPLGGNTVFVRAAALRANGGWDESCLAEDCDLGTRLSARGERIVVAYDSALATREETPHAISALVRQRTRWNQGFLQVLRKGDWRRLPPRRRAIAIYTLTQPFVQALSGIAIPLLVLGVVALRLPIVYALLSFLPLIPIVTLLAVECAALGDLGREFAVDVRLRDYARLVIGAFPYQLVLAVAALRATVREAVGVGHWEKTDHAGAHL